jgi:ribosomal protein L29
MSRKLGIPNNSELNEMTNEELQVELSGLRATRMHDTADRERGANPVPGRMRQTRIAIARILTIMQKRGIRAVAPVVRPKEKPTGATYTIPAT